MVAAYTGTGTYFGFGALFVARPISLQKDPTASGHQLAYQGLVLKMVLDNNRTCFCFLTKAKLILNFKLEQFSNIKKSYLFNVQ
jgi:hypothetical protein